MSATSEAILARVKSASVEQAKIVLATSKVQFLDLFRSFLDPADLVVLDEAFQRALAAKLAQFSASTDEEAENAADEYEASLNVIESIGARYEIVGKAKAGVLMRSVAHQVISGAFAVGGAVLQVALGIVVPGVGSFVGAGLNAGIQHVVSYFLED